MAGKNKPADLPEETQGEEPTSGTVMIKANPALARGCNHNIVLQAGGKTFTISAEPIAVTAAEYRTLSLTELRNVKAIVRA